ncbi:MAG: hypothetical protein M3137_12890 [Actinomycetota bacterium]|nr:hypothetical protein [Actinomycetota bacterium]
MATQPEHLAGLSSLVVQMSDPSRSALSRLAATNIARTYLEAVTASLVNEARQEGVTWLDLAAVFATSEQNVRARFASLRDYDQ